MSTAKNIVEVDKDLEEIFPPFIANREKDIVDLKDFISKKDYKSIEVIGHRLAGNAGSYGLPELGSIGAELENAAIAIEESKVVSLVDQYDQYMKSLELKFV